MPVALIAIVGIILLSFTPVTRFFSNNGSSKPRTLAEQIQENASALIAHDLKQASTTDSTSTVVDTQEVESQDVAPQATPERSTFPSQTQLSSAPSVAEPYRKTNADSEEKLLNEPSNSLPPTTIAPATTGSIRVVSSPNKADVYLNGIRVGTTPLFLDNVQAGTFEMEIIKANHEPEKITQSVSPLEITFIDSKLEPIQGYLQLNITPPSDVYLNDKRLSVRPTSLFERNVLASTHELSISHPQYGEWTRTITVSPHDTSTYAIDFTREIKVAVTAFDEANKGVHAEIILNNKKTGKYTPAQLSISPGSHLISVQLDGYSLSEKASHHNFEASTTAPLRFTLKKNP